MRAAGGSRSRSAAPRGDRRAGPARHQPGRAGAQPGAGGRARGRLPGRRLLGARLPGRPPGRDRGRRASAAIAAASVVAKVTGTATCAAPPRPTQAGSASRATSATPPRAPRGDHRARDLGASPPLVPVDRLQPAALERLKARTRAQVLRLGDGRRPRRRTPDHVEAKRAVARDRAVESAQPGEGERAQLVPACGGRPPSRGARAGQRGRPAVRLHLDEHERPPVERDRGRSRRAPRRPGVAVDDPIPVSRAPSDRRPAPRRRAPVRWRASVMTPP